MTKQSNRAIRRMLDLVRSGKLTRNDLVKRLEATATRHETEVRRLYSLENRMTEHFFNPSGALGRNLIFRLLDKIKGFRKAQTGGLILPRGVVRTRQDIADHAADPTARLGRNRARIVAAAESARDAAQSARRKAPDLAFALRKWKGMQNPTSLLGVLPLNKGLTKKPPLFTPHLAEVDDAERVRKLVRNVRLAHTAKDADWMRILSEPYETVLGKAHFREGVDPLQHLKFMVPVKGRVAGNTILKTDPAKRAYRGMTQQTLRDMRMSPDDAYFYSGMPDVSKGYATLQHSGKLRLLTQTQKAKMMELFTYPAP